MHRRDSDVETLLGPAPIGMDDLARAGACSIGEIRLILQELEIEGRIERHGGDRVADRARMAPVTGFQSSESSSVVSLWRACNSASTRAILSR